MMPPGFQDALQRFEVWFNEQIQCQSEFLERFQLEVRYRATFSPWLQNFRQEAINHLSQEVDGPLPDGLLVDLQTGFFWRHYIHDWLLAQPLILELPPQRHAAHQGKSTS